MERVSIFMLGNEAPATAVAQRTWIGFPGTRMIFGSGPPSIVAAEIHTGPVSGIHCRLAALQHSSYVPRHPFLESVQSQCLMGRPGTLWFGKIRLPADSRASSLKTSRIDHDGRKARCGTDHRCSR